MKYVIQILKGDFDGDPDVGKFWGSGSDEGPWTDASRAMIFETRMSAECYAGRWLKSGYVEVVEFHTPQPATLRPYTSAERKEMPIQTVIAEYFPDAIAALSRHSKKANDKHNPGEPMHWAREKSKDHLNCAGRHMLTPDAIDPDTGETEAVCLLWRAAAYVQLQEEKKLKALGIMPLSGIVPD